VNVAIRARRVDAPRKRAAHDRALRPTPAPKPELRLVPKPRVAANAVIVLVGMIAVLMLAAVVLHTRLAERQLEIDRVEAEVSAARERFDVLRQQRAELRSPTRLSIESGELGMHQAPETEFLVVDGGTLAQVLAAAGTMNDVTGNVQPPDPLDQIRRVRQAEDGG
jgi:cell division protein FtsL